MSTTNHRSGRRKELADRGAVLDSLITLDNHEVLFTQDSLTRTANAISAIKKRVLTESEIVQLVEYVKNIPPERFFGKRLNESIDMIARNFVKRGNGLAPIPEAMLEEVMGITEITDGLGSMREYQKMEINQLTSNENQIKYTYYPDKRGNAVLDRKRAEGNYSSPDNIPPFSETPAAVTAGTATGTPGPRPSTELLSAIKLLNSFLDPKSIQDTFSGMRQVWTTYQTITLPHQTIPLDSRNRLLNNTSRKEYSWYLNPAGQAGQMGNIHIQDTLKEIIRMQVSPFWLPVSSAMSGYYGKVRMIIKEFASQSIPVVEYPFSDESAPLEYTYHFEFETRRRDKNKLYLVPIYNTFNFRTSISRVEKLTIAFRTPFNELEFETDRMDMTMTSALIPTVTSIVPHNLSTGDLVYFTKYNSVSTTLNTLVNRQEGYFITKTGPNTFTVPIDTTAAGVTLPVTVYFGSKRLITQIEFTSLES